MIRTAVILALFMFFSAAAQSQATPPDERSVCLNAVGDVWGKEDDKSPESSIRGKIPGDTIASRDDLLRMTDARDDDVQIITGGDFSGWDFRGIDLHHICFQESKFVGANFAGVKGEGAGFIGSDLTDANFRQAVMPGILLRNVDLTNVQSQGADFRRGQFDGGWFDGSTHGWNIDGADMSGFRFVCGITINDGCPVYTGGDPISAKRANFTNAHIDGLSLFNADITGAILDGTIISPGQVAEMKSANIAGSIKLSGGGRSVELGKESFIRLFNAALETKQNDRPAFDCAKAGNIAEDTICSKHMSDLRKLDREVSALYTGLATKIKGLRAQQLDWLKIRNMCGAEDYPETCIRERYNARRGYLLKLAGEPDWLAPGKETVFVDEVLDLTESYKQTEDYQQILPVLAASSHSGLYVKHLQDGSFTVRGDAVGANAHLCSMSLDGARYDADSGWYGISQMHEDKPVFLPAFRIYDDEIEIYRGGKTRYTEMPDKLIHFMTCGARASFGEMVRVQLPEREMPRYRRIADHW